MTFRPGQFIVSRVMGMTLYGQIERGCCTGRNGNLCITRFWKTPKQRDFYPAKRHFCPEPPPEPFDREADAQCWHRLERECQPYDFAAGPLYSAGGQKVTAQPKE